MSFSRKNLFKTYGPPNKLRKLNNGSSTTVIKHVTSEKTNFNVFVRVRPANEKMSGNFRNVVKIIDEKLLVFDPEQEQEPSIFRGTRQKMRNIAEKQQKNLEFLFNGVFGPDISNWDIYCKTTHNLIGSILEGYNSSVFAYGATGTGKTFTMLGKRDEEPGIMYHTMSELYEQIGLISEEKECHVAVSFVEVYNENVYDLLNPSGPLSLREDASGMTIVGLKVERISNADHLLEKMAQGNYNRTQHHTDSNAQSSRSHAVFQVYIRMTAIADGQVKISKLSMIDLAGSERGMATGFTGMRFKEGSNINKSLLALGNCIEGLANNLRHIPYRDSKLTRILKDSLGGNCQTIMIANISSSSASYENTYKTLKFASSAKKITTKLTKNILSSEVGARHYMKLVGKLETEITMLKSKIQAMEGTDSGCACSRMPDMSVWFTHLKELFDERQEVCKRLLTVKSELHLLEWRINYKNSIRNIMETENSSQTPGYGMSISKIESSVRTFEGRLTALQSCIGNLNSQLKDNNEKFTKLFSEMEEARVLQYIKKDVEMKNTMLRDTIKEVAIKHLSRLLMLQKKRAETSEKALKMKEPLLINYYKLLSNVKMVTNNMATEYKNAVTIMEGNKKVSWCDIEPEGEEAASTNIISSMDFPFDESLFLINSYHQTQEMEEDENINQNDAKTKIEQKDPNKTTVRPNEERRHVDAKKKPSVLAVPICCKRYKKTPFERSSKENIMDLKTIPTNETDKSESNCFKQPIMKTPAVNTNQNHIDGLLSMRSALNSTSVNTTCTVVTATTPSLASQVPFTQSLKITHPKNRIKNHPYQRPATKSRVKEVIISDLLSHFL